VHAETVDGHQYLSQIPVSLNSKYIYLTKPLNV
jgi:hypothetical protein